MSIFRNRKIMANLKGLVENNQFKLNQVVNHDKLLAIKESANNHTTSTTLQADYSIDPDNLYIVVTETTYPVFLDRTIYVGTKTFCSVRIYDKQFKILNKKDAPRGDLAEIRSRLARRVFKLLNENYHKGK